VTRRPAAVLWDMDGTLVDTEPYWIAAEREVVESFGHEWPDHHAHAIVGFDLLDGARYIAEHGQVPLEPREIVDRLLDGVIARLADEVPWRPGARRLLAELRREGVPCALVTMSWRRFVDPVIDALPEGSFEAIVTGDEVVNGKPNPEPYQLAATALGLEPARCVAIEDSPTGLRSALAAGCRVIGVPNVRDLERGPNVTIVGSLESLDVDTIGAISAGEAFAAPAPPEDGRARRRRTLLAAAAVLAAGALGAGLVLATDEQNAALPPPLVPLDAWAPYWTLDKTVAELPGRIESLREISPFWFEATGATAVGVDPRVPASLAEEFMDIARESDAAIVPSVRDEMGPGGMAAVLADPVTRSQHVAALVQFADEGDYDGLDLDYEQFAFADGRDTWETTRPNWVAFVTELAATLHADGKTLTVSIPPVYDSGRTNASGFWVYDHGGIAEVVDGIRIMAYDYSTSEAGEIAPLDYVRRSVEGTAAVVRDDSKLVLGIPVYGYNWPVATVGTCPESAEGRTGVTPRNVDELAARRGATPERDPTTGEWSFGYELVVDDGTTSCTQRRQVHYVDTDGALERIEIARDAGLGGVALWALGYEDDLTWSSIGQSIRRPGAATASTTTAAG
jgi:HAD superfamily hydrolase (TIGR01509 family)